MDALATLGYPHSLAMKLFVVAQKDETKILKMFHLNFVGIATQDSASPNWRLRVNCGKLIRLRIVEDY